MAAFLSISHIRMATFYFYLNLFCVFYKASNNVLILLSINTEKKNEAGKWQMKKEEFSFLDFENYLFSRRRSTNKQEMYLGMRVHLQRKCWSASSVATLNHLIWVHWTLKLFQTTPTNLINLSLFLIFFIKNHFLL